MIVSFYILSLYYFGRYEGVLLPGGGVEVMCCMLPGEGKEAYCCCF